MLITKLKLALVTAIVADIIALIFKNSTICLGALSLGASIYNIVESIFRHR